MSATVITYHAIGDVPRGRDPYRMFMPVGKFRHHMEFLARHRWVVSVETALADPPGPRPAVAITFDDGYLSVLTHAAPILAEFGFPATCFVPAAWLGRRKGWDALDEQGAPLPIMDSVQLNEIRRLGLRVESHGDRHVPMDALEYADARAEIERSLDALEEATGARPEFLAYPWGRHSPDTRRAAADTGLRAAFSIGQPSGGDFARERVTVRPSDGMALFAYKTGGHYLASRRLPGIGLVYRRVIHPVVRARRSVLP